MVRFYSGYTVSLVQGNGKDNCLFYFLCMLHLYLCMTIHWFHHVLSFEMIHLFILVPHLIFEKFQYYDCTDLFTILGFIMISTSWTSVRDVHSHYTKEHVVAPVHTETIF
jgi:hypothetical protein